MLVSEILFCFLEGFVYESRDALTRQILCTQSRKWAAWRRWRWTRGSLWSGSWLAWWPLVYGSGWEPLPPSLDVCSLPGREKQNVSNSAAVACQRSGLYWSQIKARPWGWESLEGQAKINSHECLDSLFIREEIKNWRLQTNVLQIQY